MTDEDKAIYTGCVFIVVTGIAGYCFGYFNQRKETKKLIRSFDRWRDFSKILSDDLIWASDNHSKLTSEEFTKQIVEKLKYAEQVIGELANEN